MIGRFALLVLLMCTSVELAAQDGGDSCVNQARTPMERAYCKIVAANTGAVLPSLQELRRNPEKTQRLLLRRPARQAGVELPPETASRPAPSKPAVSAPQQKTSVRPGAPTQAAPIPAAGGSLSHCELRGVIIRCGANQFRLQGNLPNSRLRAGALTPANKITFAEFTGARTDQAQVMAYLYDIYRLYIEAMLDIGLGASTMSFTKFYHTFMEAEAKGTRFDKRLAAMFEFLKKDKASMGVQAHYNDELPQNLTQCMSLSETLLVCDDVQQNWVYKRSGL